MRNAYQVQYEKTKIAFLEKWPEDGERKFTDRFGSKPILSILEYSGAHYFIRMAPEETFSEDNIISMWIELAAYRFSVNARLLYVPIYEIKIDCSFMLSSRIYRGHQDILNLNKKMPLDDNYSLALQKRLNEALEIAQKNYRAKIEGIFKDDFEKSANRPQFLIDYLENKNEGMVTLLNLKTLMRKYQNDIMKAILKRKNKNGLKGHLNNVSKNDYVLGGLLYLLAEQLDSSFQNITYASDFFKLFFALNQIDSGFVLLLEFINEWKKIIPDINCNRLLELQKNTLIAQILFYLDNTADDDFDKLSALFLVLKNDSLRTLSLLDVATIKQRFQVKASQQANILNQMKLRIDTVVEQRKLLFRYFVHFAQRILFDSAFPADEIAKNILLLPPVGEDPPHFFKNRELSDAIELVLNQLNNDEQQVIIKALIDRAKQLSSLYCPLHFFFFLKRYFEKSSELRSYLESAIAMSDPSVFEQLIFNSKVIYMKFVMCLGCAVPEEFIVVFLRALDVEFEREECTTKESESLNDSTIGPSTRQQLIQLLFLLDEKAQCFNLTSHERLILEKIKNQRQKSEIQNMGSLIRETQPAPRSRTKLEKPEGAGFIMGALPSCGGVDNSAAFFQSPGINHSSEEDSVFCIQRVNEFAGNPNQSLFFGVK